MTLELSTAQKKHYRSIGHNLKPVVMINEDKGVSEGVSLELERALEDHELIKVKLAYSEPAERKRIAAELCKQHKAILVQAIGKTALFYRRAKKPDARKSNLLRPV